MSLLNIFSFNCDAPRPLDGYFQDILSPLIGVFHNGISNYSVTLFLTVALIIASILTHFSLEIENSEVNKQLSDVRRTSISNKSGKLPCDITYTVMSDHNIFFFDAFNVDGRSLSYLVRTDNELVTKRLPLAGGSEDVDVKGYVFSCTRNKPSTLHSGSLMLPFIHFRTESWKAGNKMNTNGFEVDITDAYITNRSSAIYPHGHIRQSILTPNIE